MEVVVLQEGQPKGKEITAAMAVRTWRMGEASGKRKRRRLRRGSRKVLSTHSSSSMPLRQEISPRFKSKYLNSSK